MEKNNMAGLNLKLGFQYLGSENGSIPHLDLYFTDSNGEEYYCMDYVSAHAAGKIDDDEFSKAIEFSKGLERYSKDGIKVGHFGYRNGVAYVSRIGVDPESFRHEPYPVVIEAFSKCVSDICFDYNGRRIGFATSDESRMPIRVQIHNKEIGGVNELDTKRARALLAATIGENIQYIIAEFNYDSTNGITEHRSERGRAKP